VAMVCILALLFPVISLTDDLHPEIVPADTISSKRNHCLLAAHASGDSSKQLPRTQSPVGLLPSSFPAASDFAASASVPVDQAAFPLFRASDSLSRSPPAVV
jgi:hypothetical protein